MNNFPTVKIDKYTITYSPTVPFAVDRKGRRYASHLWVQDVSDGFATITKLMTSVRIIPDRRDESVVCLRNHRQNIRATGRWLDVRKGGFDEKLLIVRVEPCEHCAHMAAWNARVEEYLRAGDVRGVLQRVDFTQWPYNLQTPAEYLLCEGPGENGHTLPWDTKEARRFLDGERPHPPDTNLFEEIRKDREAAGIAAGTAEARQHTAEILKAITPLMFPEE